MVTSELVQSTMTPEVSETYYAVRRVANKPPQNPDEFVERVLQAVRHHPEQLAEVAGRWHRRVVKMRGEKRYWARTRLGHVGQGEERRRLLEAIVERLTLNEIFRLSDDTEAVREVLRERSALPAEPYYHVLSGELYGDEEKRASRLTLSEALTTASLLFAAHQEQRAKNGLPRLEGQFTSLDDSDYVSDDKGWEIRWLWLCDGSDIVGDGDDAVLSKSVVITVEDGTEAVA